MAGRLLLQQPQPLGPLFLESVGGLDGMSVAFWELSSTMLILLRFAVVAG